MEVRFGSAAQRELEIASGFYDEQRPGLGDEFLDEYFQEENLIRIIAIAHESRRPYYWRHRIEERRPAYAALSARLRGSDAFFPIYNVRHSTAAEHKR
jgi:hypothetical protein